VTRRRQPPAPGKTGQAGQSAGRARKKFIDPCKKLRFFATFSPEGGRGDEGGTGLGRQASPLSSMKVANKSASTRDTLKIHHVKMDLQGKKPDRAGKMAGTGGDVGRWG
jgi:hypothetical protein